MGTAEIVIGYVGAAAVKSILLGLVVLGTAFLFVDLPVARPVAMLGLLVFVSTAFSLFGFIIGIWAKDFQQLQLIPLLVLTPLIFLGGSFYSIEMLPAGWRTVALFNPVVYLMSIFRWSFFDSADVPVAVSLAALALFSALCLTAVWWIFRTGWRIRSDGGRRPGPFLSQ